MNRVPPSVRVVVLAYGPEPFLREAVDSALASTGVDVTVVVVDNGGAPEALAALPDDPRVRRVTPAENLGFAGGVNAGAEGLEEDFLALLNSDAEMAPDALSRLVDVASSTDVGIASGSIRLFDSPHTMNSAGNPVHLVGLSWAGAMGEPASAHAVPADITSASGAGLAMRAEWWRRLGGFETEYFAYHEDVDLSWRTWLFGRRVVFVPDAVVLHHYEFSRNALKMYLLEKNRQIFLRSLYGRRLRAATWLPSAAFEVAMIVLARVQGWSAEKRRARRWIADHRTWLAERRRAVLAQRVRDDRFMASLLTATLDTQAVPLPRGAGILQTIVRGYWAVARRLV